jgi:YegS/Rv2252/BmrU family lipid kinase
MTYLAVIANTTKLAPGDRKQLNAAIEDAGFATVEWLMIEKGSAAKQAAAKAVKHGADVVLACGGDGTVRAAAEALVGTDTALAVMPAGTANQFANAMSIPSDLAEVLSLLTSHQTRTIDTGRCNGMTFLIMAGIGFDAALIDAADDDKERLGMVAYLRAGAKEVRQREPFPVKVEIDGDEVFDGDASCVLVANIGTLKGFEAFPDAVPTDGTLDAAVVTAAGVLDWAGLIVSAIRHRQQLSGRADLHTGKKMTVRTPKKHRFELDGGVKGEAKKLEFEVVPNSLIVCAPAVVAATAVAS